MSTEKEHLQVLRRLIDSDAEVKTLAHFASKMRDEIGRSPFEIIVDYSQSCPLEWWHFYIPNKTEPEKRFMQELTPFSDHYMTMPPEKSVDGFDIFDPIEARRLHVAKMKKTASDFVGLWKLTAANDGVQGDDIEATHNENFTAVKWYGQEFTFTEPQAAVVARLWRAWQAGTKWVHQNELLDAISEFETVKAERLRDVFRSHSRNHDAWGTMIQPENATRNAKLLFGFGQTGKNVLTHNGPTVVPQCF